MARIRINEDLTNVSTFYPHGVGGDRIQIVAGHGRTTVTINGPKTEVNALARPVAAMPEDQNVIEVKPSYASEVHRALIVLGFSESDRSKSIDMDYVPIALKTFSSWIDRVQSIPMADEELRATWTEFMRARFGGAEPPMTSTAVNEAAHAAHYAITMQLQLFPPRSRTVVGMDLGTEAWSELQEWQTAAKQRGWSTPLDMRGMVATNDTELNAWREAAKASGILSPAELSESAKINFGQFVDRKVSRDWQDETGEFSPKLAGQRIASLVNDVHGQSQRIQSLLDERELWREKTNYPHLKEFAPEWSEVECWKTETGCLTATGAGELIKSFRAENINIQHRLDELSTKLHERDQDLLTANAEIDRVKKAAQTLGLVSDKSVELAKTRAELQTKQRECQTEKERADRVQAASNARGVLLEKIGEALQLNTPVLWDPLPGQVDDLRKRAETAESMLKIEQQKHDGTKKELLAANRFVHDHSIMWKRMNAAIGLRQDAMIDIVAWIEDAQKKLTNAIIPLPKPEKVEAGQRWAFVMTCTREETIGTGLAIQFVDAGGCGFAAFREDINSGLYLGS